MKIQYQLWLIFSSLFLIVCFVVYMFVLSTYEQRLQEGYEQIAIAQGTPIIDEIKDTYPYTPNRSIGYLQRYSEQVNGRLIMLDHNKNVYADSYQQLKSNTSLNLTILERDTAPGSLFIKTDPFGYVQYTLFPFQKLDNKGYLLMIQKADQLYTEVKAFQKWMVYTLLIALAVFFFISYFVSTWFSKPIREIIFHLKKITPQKRSFSVKHRRNDEVKELINALQNMVEELNLYDERQRRFLSTSSHELKTPLATIQLILENLPYVREKEETFDEFVQDLSFQVQKMKQMVDQLLHINRIWDKQLNKNKLHTQDIQRHLLRSFQHIAQDKQIVLDFDFEPVHLFVDRALFLRGLDNVVSNAIRYSPKGQSVEISIQQDKGNIQISVCDLGIGISKEDLPHIYEPFYRANDATAWNQEGSGLGLTIVKQMIELHKGSITIDTVQNEGTCIHLFLQNT
ncbi:cell wall metabolism sensor histidine kinase WalK [Alkalihalobacillus sp. BA299]|uniref:sensor histidine kinase n=1 Tax=Alkalihalobacillus sp. BA299 TaxID=2815938 RepID=UPI001ADB43EC|nr:HAMP domain-containing sensor histidine kinase [Alkalihalobacillus sp. BA299]